MDVKTFASFENNFILAFIFFNSEYKNDKNLELGQNNIPGHQTI